MSSFNISCKAGLEVQNTFRFCFSVRLFISPSNLNENNVKQSILGFTFCSFFILGIWCHFPMACSVSAEKSPDSLIGFTLYIACCFSLAAFNILSLSLIFFHFIYNIS